MAYFIMLFVWPPRSLSGSSVISGGAKIQFREIFLEVLATISPKVGHLVSCVIERGWACRLREKLLEIVIEMKHYEATVIQIDFIASIAANRYDESLCFRTFNR